MDKPELFADENLRENAERELAGERNVIIDDLEDNENNHPTERNIITVTVYYDEIESSDEDDILDSLKEYSEENFDDFTNVTRTRRDTDNYDDILAEDMEVKKAMEEIEPSAEMKSYQKMIRSIKNEGIEGKNSLIP